MSSPVSICALGSINLDLIIQTPKLPGAGETVTGGVFHSLPGGKGANTAVAARCLGADVMLAGAAGNDDYFDQASVYLQQHGVDLNQIAKIPNAHTGLAFINLSEDGENQIAVASGANGAFLPKHLSEITTDAIITQFEIPIETIAAAIKDFNGFVAINASPVMPGLDKVLDQASLIIVNEGEFAAYENDLDGYTGLLAVTLGSKGALLYDNGKEVARAKPRPVNVVDTTGAGDAFAAAITVALVEGQPPQDALEFACAVGSLVTTKIGTQTAAPSRRDVEELLAS